MANNMTFHKQGLKGIQYSTFFWYTTWYNSVLKMIGYQATGNIGFYPIIQVNPVYPKYPRYPQIPDIPGNTREQKRYLEIPDQIFQHFYPTWSCPLPDVFSIPDLNPPNIEKNIPVGPCSVFILQLCVAIAVATVIKGKSRRRRGGYSFITVGNWPASTHALLSCLIL